MCLKLVPGAKPYYRLAVDGKLMGRPKNISSGCFMVKETIKLFNNMGMISFFIFASKDGNIGKLKSVSFPVNEPSNMKGTLTMPIASSVVLDEELQRYVKQFHLYGGNVKIGKPALFVLSKVTP
jgi:hypothetical protein